MQSRGAAATLLAMAFIVGILLGAGGVLIAAQNDVGPVHYHGKRGGYIERLTRELSLTPVQQDSVRAVMERHRSAMDSLRREVAPRFETLQQVIRSDIRTHLNTEQQEKFSDMTRQSDSTRSRAGDANAPR